MNAENREYGSFPSKISAQMVAEGQNKIKQIEVHHDEIYYLETRPSEKGRAVFVHLKAQNELFGAPFNARTTVNEYGGNSGIFVDDTLYFINFQDQNLYKQSEKSKPEIVLDAPNKRFGDFSAHPNGKWLYAVLEDHTNQIKVTNHIAKIDLETKKYELIASGHDFYAAPQINPDGDRLAFYSWDDPNMPWDGTDLWVCELDAKGVIATEKKVGGGPLESAIEPRWSPKGDFYFVSDRNGYWNLYDEENEPVYELNADFTSPPWELGKCSYTFIDIQGKPHIAAIITEKAIDSLILINLKERTISRLDFGYTVYDHLKTKKESLVFLAAGPKTHPEIVSYDVNTQKLKVLYKGKPLDIESSYLSEAKPIEFPTTKDKTAFAFYYPPTNPDYTPNKETLPPLVVFCHGGPTAHVTTALKMGIQYWTSRGFAVADINYGGSSGYGREYRDRLKFSWGVTDVNDCCALASYLVEKKLADPNRLAIRGGSSGGYTTLAALTFRKTFQVGASLYGISDLDALAKHSHKFEARYLDTLVGKYPETKDRYIELSPIFHTQKLSCPIILLQGNEDKVVPPEQSQKMYDALLEKKIPTSYILFEGEQHGFRQSQNIAKALEAELYFYATIFKISLGNNIEPIPIIGLKSS